jgi:hypothetical protein
LRAKPGLPPGAKPSAPSRPTPRAVAENTSRHALPHAMVTASRGTFSGVASCNAVVAPCPIPTGSPVVLDAALSSTPSWRPSLLPWLSSASLWSWPCCSPSDPPACSVGARSRKFWTTARTAPPRNPRSSLTARGRHPRRRRFFRPVGSPRQWPSTPRSWSPCQRSRSSGRLVRPPRTRATAEFVLPPARVRSCDDPTATTLPSGRTAMAAALLNSETLVRTTPPVPNPASSVPSVPYRARIDSSVPSARVVKPETMIFPPDHALVARRAPMRMLPMAPVAAGNLFLRCCRPWSSWERRRDSIGRRCRRWR